MVFACDTKESIRVLVHDDSFAVIYVHSLVKFFSNFIEILAVQSLICGKKSFPPFHFLDWKFLYWFGAFIFIKMVHSCTLTSTYKWFWGILKT